MLRKTARIVGLILASVPIVGLVVTYCCLYLYYRHCMNSGEPFSPSDMWWLPFVLSCMPTAYLLAPLGKLMPSPDGVAMHFVMPIQAIIVSVLNFYIGFYGVLLIGKLGGRFLQTRRRGQIDT